MGHRRFRRNGAPNQPVDWFLFSSEKLGVDADRRAAGPSAKPFVMQIDR
jgi:hypothetical protein